MSLIPDAPPAYQVLARKHRPQDFDALIGQEAMVRVLRAAFETGRIHHAFLLTGVRGVGKTTTARIIARGLNCEGAPRPTIAPCGVCEPCRRIAEGRFVDVLEIDAASNTGVDFVRDLTEIARTQPTARYKVFILDEVHMLSTSAFNALLKTLEEPPGHVKFIFATTEINKVPVTVRSRCQRFDLRRIEPEAMVAFLADICGREGATATPEALALIARAAEGSVRDALSLLDQAIAPGGEVDAAAVRAMIGLADRGRTLDLFEAVMRGDAAGALAELGAQYADGADPAAVLRDLAESAHWLSVVKVAPDAADDPAAAAADRARGRDLAARLPMRALARTWQMLLKALEELAHAPNAMMAAEMAVIRLTHVAELPSPEDLVRRLTDAPAPPAAPRAAPQTGGGGATALAAVTRPASEPEASPATLSAAAPQPVHVVAPQALAAYPDFDAVLALIRAKRDLRLLVAVETSLRLVRYTPGRIAVSEGAPEGLTVELAQRLGAWTGARWAVETVPGEGAETVAQRRAAAAEDLRSRVEARPLVAATLAAFPGAEVKAIRPLQPAAQTPPLEAYAEEMGEDWSPVDDFGADPFEED